MKSLIACILIAISTIVAGCATPPPPKPIYAQRVITDPQSYEGLAATAAAAEVLADATSSSTSSSTSGGGPVHIREYVRKDGTIVHAHTRSRGRK